MKRSYVGFSLLYTFSFMALGSFMPLIGQYLAFIGFSGTQIGTITAAGTCVAIFAGAFWGKVYDGSKNKYLLIMLLCLAASLIAVSLLAIRWYPLFLLLYGCMYFFQAPVMPLSDSLTLEESLPFSRIRKWGAVGFALGVFGSGRLAAMIGLETIFWFYSICFFLSALLLMLMTGSRGSVRQSVRQKKTGSYRMLLRDKRLMQLILCTFFVGGTNVANNTYFSFLYIEGGGTIAGVGIVMLLMVGSEAPFMQWSARLAGRFSLEKTILGAIGVSVIRFFIYSLEPSYIILALLFFMQGAVNGIILVEFVRYVNLLAPSGHEGMAVAMYYALGSNGSAIVCQLIGGAALDRFGPGGVYFFFAAFNLIGLILYLIFGLQKKSKKEREKRLTEGKKFGNIDKLSGEAAESTRERRNGPKKRG
ncbi:MFS transporter [Ihubacter massiliensis]|nr:MFS transporter [Ihubacter massiliensis]MCO7121705.1 MFS transporter [Ihubacter massiliensis]MDE8733995.1 MFS transporter [Eubacteriales bacterium DFI.9.88]